MKNTGEVRGIIKSMDKMGRVTIPKCFREELGIKDGAKFEIYLLENEILIRKGE